MANHQATKKSARQNRKRRLHNRYYKKTTRNALREIKTETDSKVIDANLPKIISMIDKLAKRNTIHKNKAANLKSRLVKYLQTNPTSVKEDTSNDATPQKEATHSMAPKKLS